jgi:hypothetical protein
MPFIYRTPFARATTDTVNLLVPLLEFPIINQQLSVVVCLETSSEVYSLSSLSDMVILIYYYEVTSLMQSETRQQPKEKKHVRML